MQPLRDAIKQTESVEGRIVRLMLEDAHAILRYTEELEAMLDAATRPAATSAPAQATPAAAPARKPRLITEHEAARMAGLAIATIQSYRYYPEKQGCFPPPVEKRGRVTYYDRDAVIAWLATDPLRGSRAPKPNGRKPRPRTTATTATGEATDA